MSMIPHVQSKRLRQILNVYFICTQLKMKFDSVLTQGRSQGGGGGGGGSAPPPLKLEKMIFLA